jgi:hypothetical protein
MVAVEHGFIVGGRTAIGIQPCDPALGGERVGRSRW